MSEIKVNPNNLVGDEREQLLALIEKANKKPKRFKPELDKEYWSVDITGTAFGSRWGNDLYDKMKYGLQNCFETEEEAKFEAEKRKVFAELEIFALENNDKIDWCDDSQEKFFFFYDYISGSLEIDYRYRCRNQRDTYFSSAKLCKQAIEKVGRDRIEKYIFGVEEV